MVEQNAIQALRVSDRGYVMVSGEVRLEAPANTLLDDERVAELYSTAVQPLNRGRFGFGFNMHIVRNNLATGRIMIRAEQSALTFHVSGG